MPNGSVKVLTYDYAIVRVVPRVERGEFVNVGVIVCCARQDYLDAGIELDDARLRAIDPTVDVDALAANLATIPLICAGGPAAGPLGRLSVRERFDWLVAPRSTVIQTAAVHIGRCDRLEGAIEHLLDRMVRVSGPVR
ncbi:MAG: DUF3037 domain-containing protein [Burkholderiaceae bacterium]